MPSDDTEFNALAKIVKELTPLDQAARDRVLMYAVTRFASQSFSVAPREVPS